MTTSSWELPRKSIDHEVKIKKTDKVIIKIMLDSACVEFVNSAQKNPLIQRHKVCAQRSCDRSTDAYETYRVILN
jgi:hypothetical protein